jgi:hypothetical protein
MVKGKVSLVAFGFRSSGDPMIKAFSMHWEDVFGMHNNKKPLFGAIFTLKVHVICQDRLGTNTGRGAEKRKCLVQARIAARSSSRSICRPLQRR